MANKNPDNMHWKAKLEDAERLPAETVGDKATAWKKLYRRLHGKPRRNRVAGYWAVAACLLLALVIPFIFTHTDKTAITKNAVQKDAATKPGSRVIQPQKEEMATATVVTPAKEKRTVKPRIEKGKNIIKDTLKEAFALNNTTIEENKINSTVPVADSTLTTALAAAQPKKKLKVVHINELGDPIEESPVMARTADQHAFQLKLANQEVFVNTSIAAAKNSFTFLKTKPSPTN